jgi:diphosphomevalonate decarboxylase
MKATAIAPSNIAFIKYWGKVNDELRLPANGSISMNLSNLLTTTTVEFSPKYIADEVVIEGIDSEEAERRVIVHVDRIRKHANISLRVKVMSQNNFPDSTGLSSSASGFAALTAAGVAAAELTMSKKELSALARLGSGSACRSIPDGFVEWVKGDDHDSSYAVSIHKENYWDIADVVAIVSKEKKTVPTTEGQNRIRGNKFFPMRLAHIDEKITQMKFYLGKHDFSAFGALIESEALEMHAIMLTSEPPLLYLSPESLSLLIAVRKWRSKGLEGYVTFNTGQDVHIICQRDDTALMECQLKELPFVSNVIINKPSVGVRMTSAHLF